MAEVFEKIVSFLIHFLYKSINWFLALFRHLLFGWNRMPKNIKKVLIFRVGNIGDIICAIPSFLVIKENFPKQEVVLLSSPGEYGRIGARELVTNAPFLDGSIIYYQEEIRTLTGKFDLISRLRKERFDLFIELPQDLTNFSTEIRNILFAKLIGAKYAFGFMVNTLKIFGKIQTKYLHFDNEIERLSKILKKEKLQSDKISFSLPISKEEIKVVDDFLMGLDNKKLIGMNPNANKRRNLWPLNRFAELGKRLIKDYNVNIIIIGGKGDEERTTILKDAIGENAFNTGGSRFTPLQTVELVRRCQLLISNDTGSIHMAAAVGTPIVGIYPAWEIKGKWFPYGSKNIILRKEPKCHTCYSKDCRFPTCLEMISVEEVYKAIETIICKR